MTVQLRWSAKKEPDSTSPFTQHGPRSPWWSFLQETKIPDYDFKKNDTLNFSQDIEKIIQNILKIDEYITEKQQKSQYALLESSLPESSILSETRTYVPIQEIPQKTPQEDPIEEEEIAKFTQQLNRILENNAYQEEGHVDEYLDNAFHIHPNLEDIQGGFLSPEELEELRLVMGQKVKETIFLSTPARVMLLGDILIRSPMYTADSLKVLKYAAWLTKERQSQAVILVGSPIAGVPQTKKQHRGFFFAKGGFRNVEEQLAEADRILETFHGKRYAVTTDEDDAWVEVVAKDTFERRIRQKKEDGIETDGGVIEFRTLQSWERQDLNNRIWAESYFDAVYRCIKKKEDSLRLHAPLVDRLVLKYPGIEMTFQHMRPSQYFSAHTGPGAVAKDQKLHGQLAARENESVGKGNKLLVTAHDLDLRWVAHDPLNMQVSIFGVADILGHLTLPKAIQNDIKSMPRKSVSSKGKYPDKGAMHITYTEDDRYIIEPILFDYLSGPACKINDDPNVPEIRRTIFSTGDTQGGSLANKHIADFLLKYLDYVIYELPKHNKNVDYKQVWWQGGDLVEAHNYPKAPLRNILPAIEQQVDHYLNICSPYVESVDERGHLQINPLIEQIVLCQGNHEQNSTKKENSFNADNAIYNYYVGILRSQFGGDMDKVQKMFPFSQFQIIQREGHKEELFNTMAAYAEVCGYPILGFHFFQPGSPNGGDFTVMMESWLNRAGVIAKDYAMLMQWHYHTFSMGSHAGKMLISWSAPTGISDFEYVRGLSPKYNLQVVHLSNKRLPQVEILTSKFFDKYQLQHPMFKDLTAKQFDDKVMELVKRPVPIMKNMPM